MIPTAAASWIERARRVTPGGVHSPVRAFKAMGAAPLAIVEARGAHVFDQSGRRYIDWIGAWGPALLGHAHPGIEKALAEALPRGLVFGLASPGEIELAERVTERVPGCEMVRFVVSGTEATMSAVRVARAATGRSLIVKFAGAYHGHADMFLVSAGSGVATLGIPDSPGVTPGAAGDTIIARFNDRSDVQRCFDVAPDRIAALIVEPVIGNMGCVPPDAGFLQFLHNICSANGALLIFDEVMTGFRVSRGGAAERYGVTPDLITLGKIVGGGLPLAAFGGRRDLMSLVAPEGPVYQAGTFAAHPLAIAAGLAMLDAIDAIPDLYGAPRRGAHLQAAFERGRRRCRRSCRGPARPLDVDAVLLRSTGAVLGRCRRGEPGSAMRASSVPCSPATSCRRRLSKRRLSPWRTTPRSSMKPSKPRKPP